VVLVSVHSVGVGVLVTMGVRVSVVVLRGVVDQVGNIVVFTTTFQLLELIYQLLLFSLLA